jgi:hypothetical protein
VLAGTVNILEYNQVNHALQKYADTKSNAYFVTSNGLTANYDGLHFDAVSQRRLGIRYFEAYSEGKNVLAPLSAEDDIVKVIQDRPLTKTEKIALLEISFVAGKMSLKDFEERLAVLNN